jgi:hypothetical protein
MGEERLWCMQSLVREKACRVIWDNINIMLMLSQMIATGPGPAQILGGPDRTT